MRVTVLLVWLMLPVLVGFYHFGPGQKKELLDQASAAISTAQQQVAKQQWGEAEKSYELALQLLPGDRTSEIRRIRLERAKAQMYANKLPEAHQELNLLVDELKADQTSDQHLLADAQATLANSQYYVTWLMRLEGQPRDEWEPVIEAARQTYRSLAEEAATSGDESLAQRNREDLESVIRLARMNLSDLQALPLPSQCQGCCSGQCRNPGKGKGKGKSKQGGEKVKDARGASSGPPPDGRGS